MDKIVTIERLAFGGEGVGRVDGKVVFVPLTVPGDRVKVRIVSDHRRYERGELIEVLTASQDRTTPRCAVFGQCGGCQWQHISYAKQLVAKEENPEAGKVSGGVNGAVKANPNPRPCPCDKSCTGMA